ncbi:MAG: c-type cytochrome [Acidimicrobiia bacterium]
MRRVSLILVLPLAFVTAGCGSQAAAGGPQLYTTNCAACHGPTGEGSAAGPALVGIETEDDQIADVIRNGVDRDDAFPAMGPVGALDDAEIVEVIAHIRTLQSGG